MDKTKSDIRKNNFMDLKQSSTDGLKKRENFAVNLRKKRTQAILKEKRRKIAQFTGGKENQEGSQYEEYTGYPPWKAENYYPMQEILQNLF